MKRLSLLLIASAVFFSSCSDDTTVDSDTADVEIQFSDPNEDTTATPEILLDPVNFGAENRDAVMVILRGYLEPEAEIPFRFEVKRVVEAELYRDVDKEQAPNRFITRAEMLDEKGEVLWNEDVDSLFQVLEFLKVVVSETSPIKLNIGQVYKFVDTQYPELLEFGITVPTGIANAKTFRLTVPDENGDLVEALNLPIADLIKQAAPSEFKPIVEKIVDNGKSEDKIDIVIVADGYMADREKKFVGDARAIKDRLFETEPFKSHKNDFNIHTVFLASEEGGAGYDCTGNPIRDRGCKSDVRDTAFQTTFVVSGLAEKFGFNVEPGATRAAMPLQVAKLYEVASSVPFDQIVLVANTDRTSGFAGLYFSVVTAFDERFDFPHTAVHELGHSYGLLGDEYSAESDACLSSEPRISLPVNIASSLKPLKWEALVDEGAPIPTPDSMSNSVDIGAFEGAYSCEDHYRPAATCKMRDSNTEFCAVCSQQLVNRIGTGIDAISAAGPTITKTKDGLSITIDNVENRQVKITLGTEEVPSKDGVATITRDQIGTDWKELKVVVEFTSDFVKVPTPQSKTEKSVWFRTVPGLVAQ